MLGKVEWFDKARGIGIIETQDGAEVSFDRNTLENSAGCLSISSGQLVDFEITEKSNVKEATIIHLLS